MFTRKPTSIKKKPQNIAYPEKPLLFLLSLKPNFFSLSRLLVLDVQRRAEQTLNSRSYIGFKIKSSKMDPRFYGNMPFGGDEPEEDENLFPFYSARSQHDMSVMVSALSQVIGNQENSSHDSPSVHNPQDPSLPVAPTHQDQGRYIDAHIYVKLFGNFVKSS